MVETGSVFTEGHRNAVRPENNVNQLFFFSKKIIYYLNDFFSTFGNIRHWNKPTKKKYLFCLKKELSPTLPVGLRILGCSRMMVLNTGGACSLVLVPAYNQVPGCTLGCTLEGEGRVGHLDLNKKLKTQLSYYFICNIII